jgi:uncharacterized Zn-finger protein
MSVKIARSAWHRIAAVRGPTTTTFDALHVDFARATFETSERMVMVRRNAMMLFEGEAMADQVVPHFHNDPGVPVIEIGAREFMCVGARPPFDHPHVFLDMGEDAEIICPYCSTLYRHDPALDPHAARPPACALTELA